MIRAAVLILLLSPLAASAQGRVLVDPPVLTGVVAAGDFTYEVVVRGEHVLVPAYGDGLLVVDVSDRSNPFIAGRYNSPGYAVQCALSGTRAYVASHSDGGLQVVDVSSPGNPWPVGSYIPGDAVVMTAWYDGVVLVGTFANRIEMVDVSSPSHPVPVSSYATVGAPRHAVLDGAIAYVCDYTAGLIVLDLADVTAPVLVGSLAASRPLGADLDGTTLYLACENGLRSVDVSDPTSPVALDRVPLPGPAVKVDVVGGYAAVAAHVAGGLQVVDVSDPTDLAVATHYVTGAYSHGVAVNEDHAFLADGRSLKVFRVFESAVPTESTSLGRIKARYRSE